VTKAEVDAILADVLIRPKLGVLRCQQCGWATHIAANPDQPDQIAESAEQAARWFRIHYELPPCRGLRLKPIPPA
jgi:hypothetical protein